MLTRELTSGSTCWCCRTLQVPSAAGGPAAPGRTRRGARPSAAAAARARPCTCPCRRAWWSPRSTTRWRGAASAATASTCRDVPSVGARYLPRVRASRRVRRAHRREKGAKHAAPAGRGMHGRSGHRAGRRPTCVLAVPGRAPSTSVDIHGSDRHGGDGRTSAMAARGGLPWQGRACAAVHGVCMDGAAVHWSVDVARQKQRRPGLNLRRGGGAGRESMQLPQAPSWQGLFFPFLRELLA